MEDDDTTFPPIDAANLDKDQYDILIENLLEELPNPNAANALLDSSGKYECQ